MQRCVSSCVFFLSSIITLKTSQLRNDEFNSNKTDFFIQLQVNYLLSMPVNGSGKDPYCSFKSLSILNSMCSTFAIKKSIFLLFSFCLCAKLYCMAGPLKGKNEKCLYAELCVCVITGMCVCVFVLNVTDI